jgi:hypothetical protein
MLWDDLKSNDSAKAYRAIWGLVGTPKESLVLLKGRVQPRRVVDPRHLQRLVSDLDDPKFLVREKAFEELARLAELAEPTLRNALRSEPPPEMRARAEALLDKLASSAPSPEQLRELRVIEVLEHIRNEEARQLLGSLASGTPDARLTQEAGAALERLGRPGSLEK